MVFRGDIREDTRYGGIDIIFLFFFEKCGILIM